MTVLLGHERSSATSTATQSASSGFSQCGNVKSTSHPVFNYNQFSTYKDSCQSNYGPGSSRPPRLTKVRRNLNIPTVKPTLRNIPTVKPPLRNDTKSEKDELPSKFKNWNPFLSLSDNEELRSRFNSWSPFTDGFKAEDVKSGVAFTFKGNAGAENNSTLKEINPNVSLKSDSASFDNHGRSLFGDENHDEMGARNKLWNPFVNGKNHEAGESAVPSQGGFAFSVGTESKDYVRRRQKQNLQRRMGVNDSAETFKVQNVKMNDNVNGDNPCVSKGPHSGLADNPSVNKMPHSGMADNPFVNRMPHAAPAGNPNVNKMPADNPFVNKMPVDNPFVNKMPADNPFVNKMPHSGLVAEEKMESSLKFTFGLGTPKQSHSIHATDKAATVANKGTQSYVFSAGTSGAFSQPSVSQTLKPENNSGNVNSWPFMGSLSSSLNQIFAFSSNEDAGTKNLSRKKREKCQIHSSIRGKHGRPSTTPKPQRQKVSAVTNQSEEGSPMDCSPYRDTAANNAPANTPPVSNMASVPSSFQPTFSAFKAEEIKPAHTVETHSDNGDDMDDKVQHLHSENLSDVIKETLTLKDDVVLPNSECEQLKSDFEQVQIIDREEKQACNNNEEKDQSIKFAFSASASASSSSTPPSNSRRHFKRFLRPGHADSSIKPCGGNTKFGLPPIGLQLPQENNVISERGGYQSTFQAHEETKKDTRYSNSLSMGTAKQKEESAEAIRAANILKAEQACEKWRLRGNQAYANGDFHKAEDYYSRGINTVSLNEASHGCIRATMLCYSNRAATRMAVGRVREALSDCKQAMAIDPNFLKVQTRAASCHLSLGEIESAIALFKRCLHSAREFETLDLKIATEASDGLTKAQKALEQHHNAAQLIKTRKPSDVTTALQIVNEGLTVSMYSESFLEMKALALLALRKYDNVIQVCQQSLDAAERNHSIANMSSEQGSDHSENDKGKLTVKYWRWNLRAKALFFLGRLEEALDLLTKCESACSTMERYDIESVEALDLFTAKVRELLRHKGAGNKAFQAGKHSEAVEHYTAALACNGDSWPFTAVCFCNRAAASQALGLISDAIADCSRAIALDPNYPKAISRRATLHETVRNYTQAASDLQRLIKVLECHENSISSNLGKLGSPNNAGQDLRQARNRLTKVQDEARVQAPLDHYLILGVASSCTEAEIKKAYRKAALRHHPDKAGQFCFKSENGEDGCWKEIEEEFRRDAERLFKMIGESYAVLSDPEKRMHYDNEEELRKFKARSKGIRSETAPESYRYSYERGNRRQRNRWEPSYGFASEYQARWSNGPDAAQPNTYARRQTHYRSNDAYRWNDWD